MDLSGINFIIFDLDNTLSPYNAHTLYPDAAEFLRTRPDLAYAICSNQGGIGLRYWQEKNSFGEPQKYPTYDQFLERLRKLFPDEKTRPRVYICARYQSKSTGKWCPVPDGEQGKSMWRQDWRKPAPGMLIAAMQTAGVGPDETLMVGDSPEDKAAAEAAGCRFASAWEFFGRENPQEEKLEPF